MNNPTDKLVPTEAERVVSQLTEAQRRYLTTEAKHDFVWGEKRWMTYPPPNTHNVLHRLGLVLTVGLITELGLEVRRLLEDEE